ncbi:MAG: amino acid permease [Gammaproteobacteria bacterium]
MTGKPTRQLSLFDAVCIIVGIVIGAGIYETTPAIAGSVTTPAWLMLFWLLGGLLSLIGALCYAEVITRYPEEGGDYVFLNKAYGKRMGFLFAWSGFWVVRPANIGAVSFIFARYATDILPLNSDGHDFMIYAAAAVITFTAANILGVQTGKWSQNILTVLTVVGLLIVITAGLIINVPSLPAIAGDGLAPGSNYYLALILVLFTYGGWSNIAYVAAEVKQPRKNILRSLIIGVTGITLIYILVNLAFINVLGLEGMAESSSAASDMIRAVSGETGALLISLLICITCLGNVNGMLLTESRIYYALGRDNRFYGFLGTWSPRLDSPIWSLTLQAAITLAMIVLLGGDERAFERLVVLSAPLFWFFVLLVSLSLFLFRFRHGETITGYRVPFYPWLPAAFCLSNLFLLYASLAYAWQQGYPEVIWIGIVLITGILASLWQPRSKKIDEKKDASHF